jgi:hypothetical protein
MEAREGLEDPVSSFRRQADAVVGDLQQHTAGFRLQAHPQVWWLVGAPRHCRKSRIAHSARQEALGKGIYSRRYRGSPST